MKKAIKKTTTKKKATPNPKPPARVAPTDPALCRKIIDTHTTRINGLEDRIAKLEREFDAFVGL